MANTRRIKSKRNSRLTLVSPANPAGTNPAGTEPVGTEPASAEPASAEPASIQPAGTEPEQQAELVQLDELAELEQLAGLRRSLAAAGAPAEILALLDNAASAEDALDQLAQAGVLPSPEESLNGLLESFEPLLEPGCDQLSAELSGFEFLSVIGQMAPADVGLPTLLLELIGQAEGQGSGEALAMLRLLAAIGPAEVREPAQAAGDRLVSAGQTDLPWTAGLGQPKPGKCFGYRDDLGAQQSLAMTFSYGRRRHAVVVLIDHDLGGGVKDCFVSDSPDWIRSRYRAEGSRAGLEFRDYQPAEARAILELALGRQPCPVEPDQVEDVASYLGLLRARAELLPAGGQLPSRYASRGAASPAAGRASRNGRRGPASGPGSRDVHRVKITLRGARPPIWRRLEVPSDITVRRLHDVIQQAFGWEDSHLWVFSAPDGEYGIADRELGFRSAASRKLAAVAPDPGDRVRYTYDFGDGWEHDIVVEDVRPAEPGVAYPRCTAGRRACPPEDCGGIWGYQELLAVLADPGDEQHADMLEWLGLESAAEFDPAAFDPDETSIALAPLARVLVKR